MKKKIFMMLGASLFATSTFAAPVIGGVAVVQQNQIPDLPSYTDPVMETNIDEEETPL